MYSFNAVRGLQQKKYTSNIFFWRLGSNVINRTESRDIVGIKVRPHTHTHTKKVKPKSSKIPEKISGDSRSENTSRETDQSHQKESWSAEHRGLNHLDQFQGCSDCQGRKKSLGEIVRRVRFSNSHYSHLPHSDWPETLRGRKERMIDLRVSRELRLKIALFLLK